jgi:hypothetical protein
MVIFDRNSSVSRTATGQRPDQAAGRHNGKFFSI